MSKGAKGSRTDTAVKLVLVFFIAMLAFSVGAFLGKSVSDSEHRRAALEEDYSHSQMAMTDSTSEDTERVSEKEIASLTEEFVASEKKEMARVEAETSKIEKESRTPAAADGYKKVESAPQVQAEPAKTKVTAEVAKPKVTADLAKAELAASKSEETAPAKSGPSPTAERIAENKAPAADPKPSRQPDTVLPSVATSAVGKYTVQIASYADEEEAKGHAAELRGKGWNAFYLPAAVAGKTWYRVSVGLFTTAKSANDYKKELAKEAKIQSAIVQKIVK